MKPVFIFRYAPTEGPGYFAEYLNRRGISFRVVGVDNGEPVPCDPQEASGVALMGGPMSVNDPLPWMAPMLGYIRRCVTADVPLIGHCLGGQLMSRALGGEVRRNPVKEIGWGDVHVLPVPQAHRWFGGTSSGFLSFHWHGETFSIPPGATRLLSSEHCANQGYALGKHLALQCHIEMTQELVKAWCLSGAREIERNRPRSPAVQSVSEIQAGLDDRLDTLHRVADGIYERWCEGLVV